MTYFVVSVADYHTPENLARQTVKRQPSVLLEASAS